MTYEFNSKNDGSPMDEDNDDVMHKDSKVDERKKYPTFKKEE
jgi:hypothetical protein